MTTCYDQRIESQDYEYWSLIIPAELAADKLGESASAPPRDCHPVELSQFVLQMQQLGPAVSAVVLVCPPRQPGSLQVLTIPSLGYNVI